MDDLACDFCTAERFSNNKEMVGLLIAAQVTVTYSSS